MAEPLTAISGKSKTMAESPTAISEKSEIMSEHLATISGKAEITEFCKILAEKFGGKEKSA